MKISNIRFRDNDRPKTQKPSVQWATLWLCFETLNLQVQVCRPRLFSQQTTPLSPNTHHIHDVQSKYNGILLFHAKFYRNQLKVASELCPQTYIHTVNMDISPKYASNFVKFKHFYLNELNLIGTTDVYNLCNLFYTVTLEQNIILS